MAIMPYGVGIIGCGRAATDLHIPALARAKGLRLVAVADSRSEQLSAISQHGRIKTHTDYQVLLEDPAIHIVAICVPPVLHAEVTIAALSAGKHVYLEKPMAVSRDDGLAIVKAADHAKGHITMGFNLRSHRLVEKAKSLVAAGLLGRVELIRMVWTSGFQLGRDWPAWRLERDLGGGVMQEVAVHHLDLLRYLLTDEIESITALSHSSVMVDQTSVIEARMVSGILATIAVCQQTADQNEVEIYGDRGILRFSCYRTDSLRFQSIAELSGGLMTRLHEHIAWLHSFPEAFVAAWTGGDFRHSYVQHWQRFGESLRTGGPVPATLEDGERALHGVLAALRSAGCGVSVPLSSMTEA